MSFTNVYWTVQSTNGSVLEAPLIDSTSLYWTESNEIGSGTTTSSIMKVSLTVYWANAGGTIMKLSKGGGSATSERCRVIEARP